MSSICRSCGEALPLDRKGSEQLCTKCKIVKTITPTIYECYRVAFYAGEFPDGTEVTSAHVAEQVYNILIKEYKITPIYSSAHLPENKK